MKATQIAKPHSNLEDLIALGVGALLISLGLSFLNSAGLLTSGISGVVFIVHYAFGWDIGKAFFLLNLPFYLLAFGRLGKAFAIKTLVAVSAISLLTANARQMYGLQAVHPAFASIAGGVLAGMGLLALFRHAASVGGVSALAVYLQGRCGWRAGHVLMAVDGAVLLTSFMVIDKTHVLWSVVGAIVLNLMVMLNHKPGRYMTV